MICRVEGCDRPVLVQKQRLCRAHYRRMQRYGTPDEPSRRTYTWAGSTCSVAGCKSDVESKGLCLLHYYRQLRRQTTGDPDPQGRRRGLPVTCTQPGCSEIYYGVGLCRHHYDLRRPARPGKQDPARARHRAKHRRARLRGAEGSHTDLEWQYLLAILDHSCTYCGGAADTKDHVVPLASGGSDWIENITPACRSCNSSKGDRLLSVWLQGR